MIKNAQYFREKYNVKNLKSEADAIYDEIETELVRRLDDGYSYVVYQLDKLQYREYLVEKLKKYGEFDVEVRESNYTLTSCIELVVSLPEPIKAMEDECRDRSIKEKKINELLSKLENKDPACLSCLLSLIAIQDDSWYKTILETLEGLGDDIE